MTWNCTLVEYSGDWTEHKVGDMFWGPTLEELKQDDPKWDYALRTYASHLSDYYWANNSARPPLFVMLPGLIPFCVDGQTWSHGVHSGGWTVTGVAPDITVGPSINQPMYHGFIQGGVISDDVEGRHYNEEGYEVRPV